jgi:hypothetical protein
LSRGFQSFYQETQKIFVYALTFGLGVSPPLTITVYHTFGILSIGNIAQSLGLKIVQVVYFSKFLPQRWSAGGSKKVSPLSGTDLYHSVVGKEAEDASHSPQLVHHNDLTSIGGGKYRALGIGIGNLENQILGIAQSTIFSCVHLVDIESAYAQGVLNFHNYHFLSFLYPYYNI